MWKSNNIGADQLIITPDNPKFRFGIFWIAIDGFRTNLNQLAVCIRLKDIKPQYMLVDGESMNCTVKDIEFFKF